jgi:hypothetical protein
MGTSPVRHSAINRELRSVARHRARPQVNARWVELVAPIASRLKLVPQSYVTHGGAAAGQHHLFQKRVLSYRVMLATKWRLPPQDECAACATTPGIRQGSRWSVNERGISRRETRQTRQAGHRRSETVQVALVRQVSPGARCGGFGAMAQSGTG